MMAIDVLRIIYSCRTYIVEQISTSAQVQLKIQISIFF